MNIGEAASRFRLWASRPDIFVREVFGVTPDAWQDEILKAFPNNQRIAMKASKGVGKSAVESWLAWNFLLTRGNPKIAATSITGANLADGLWSEMALWQQKNALLRDNFTWTKTRIFLNEQPETWFMSARPWSKTADKQEQGNTLAGIHAQAVMFVLDESGDIPESVAMAAEAALTSCEEGHILQAGNPTSLSGMLYKSCVRDRNLWYVVEISSDPLDPKRSTRVSKEWAQSQIDSYGRENPFVKVNVLGQFPDAAFNALIGIDEVNEATRRHHHESSYALHARIIGVDVAKHGADSTVISMRQGLQMFNPMQYRNIDGTQGANIVARKWQDWSSDAVFIDDTGGFGSSWIDNLVRLGFSPVGIHFNEKPANPRYYNKRTEMMFELVEWIKRGGCIPDVQELKAALTETTYTFKGDSLIVEPKELIKARLGYSPDHLDSAMLTFAQPVLKAQPANSSSNGMSKLRSNYNPLSPAYIKNYLAERH